MINITINNDRTSEEREVLEEREDIEVIEVKDLKV